MASSEKTIAVLPYSQTAGPGSRAVEAHDLGGAPSSSDSPAPMLDRLVTELEGAFGAALSDGAFTPAHSRPPLSTKHRSSVGNAHERKPCQETRNRSAHSEKRSFEAVRNGDEWAVTLPESETNAEDQGHSPGIADQAETVDQCATAEPRSGSPLPRRFGRGLLRRVAIPGVILIPLGVSAVVLVVVIPRSLPTPVQSEDAPESTGLSASIGGQMADELGRITMENGAEPKVQLSEVHEPVMPRLVKTVRIREQPDQATADLPSPQPPAVGLLAKAAEPTGSGELAEGEDQRVIETRPKGEPSRRSSTGDQAANAGQVERLQAEPRKPARTDKALSGMDRDAVESDRWPSAIPFESDGQPRELIAGEEQPDDTELARSPAEAKVEPDAATASAPDSSGSEAQDPSVSTADRPAEPTRFAATTTHVNMRAGPTSKAAVVTVVPAGKRVGVIGCHSWCEVVFEGERGWVHSSFVGGANSGKEARTTAAGLRIAPGTPLIGADGGRIGTVRGQSTNDAGQVFFLVELARELGAAVPSIWLRKEHFVSADEQARVKFTRDRLLRSLPSQSGAEASRGTEAS